MERRRKLFAAKSALILGVIPVLIWAHNFGPDAGSNGVPGESNCTQSQCHVGTLNSGTGSVSVAFPNGQNYTPGVKQHLVVTIADPNERLAGFQLTARVSGNTKSQAGSFASTDGNTLVLCSDTNLRTMSELDAPNSQVCPANQPLSYIEHNLVGASRTVTSGAQTFEFDWTPPASDVGNVVIYVEGNGANGDGQPTGDRIYSKTYTLAPSAGGGTPPAITAGGVVNGASFHSGLSANSFLTIFGSDLAPSSGSWDNAIVNGQLPTSLNNVTVTVGGKPAYLSYVSSGQINALAPDAGTGTMSVTVTTPAGSNSTTVDAQSASPGFFLWANQYAIATRQDFSYAVKNGTFPGTTTTSAKPGDVIILWGTGFGPTSPAIPFGVQVPSDKTYSTANPVTVTLNGNLPVTVFGAALAPGFAGLYQVAIQIPDNAPDGDLPIVATVNGISSPSGVTLTVQR